MSSAVCDPFTVQAITRLNPSYPGQALPGRHDQLIMIMHQGGGGRSLNDHLITLLILVWIKKRAKGAFKYYVSDTVNWVVKGWESWFLEQKSKENDKNNH